jgi:P4 family phage/plasmid primase-like protien
MKINTDAPSLAPEKESREVSPGSVSMIEERRSEEFRATYASVSTDSDSHHTPFVRQDASDNDGEKQFSAEKENAPPTKLESLGDFYDLLGDAVLLPIPYKTKGPIRSGWQKTTFTDTQAADYRAELETVVAEGGNIGVLLGFASGGLIAVDLDSDDRVLEFVRLNGHLGDTLTSRGKRGCQFWFRMKPGSQYPPASGIVQYTDRFTVNKKGKRVPENFAEWRANGNQSVIFGTHPTGCEYTLLEPVRPLEVAFEDIKWPANTTHSDIASGNRAGDTGKRASSEAASWAERFKGDLSTLNCQSLVEELGIDIQYENDEKIAFYCPWQDEHSSKNNRKDASLLFPKDGKWPSFKCFHQNGCRHKDLKFFLEWAEEQSPGIVDRNCSKTFQQKSEKPSDSWPRIEGEAAAELHKLIGQVRCVGSDWLVEVNGIWLPTDRDAYRPQALEALPQAWRTQARSVEVLKRLEGEQQVRRDQFCGAAKFDKDGSVLLAVKNGILRIGKGPNADDAKTELLPPNPAYGFTSALPVAYDPEAIAPEFCRVLQESLSDPRDCELLLDVLATALIPDARWEIALVLQGEAGTGKSTVIAPVFEIFGDAASSLSMVDLCHPSGYKLAMLDHKLINLATELNTLEVDDTGLFKQLVSGERFTARPIYGKPFEMRSSATLVFLANSLPRFKHGTDAEARRLRFVKFGRRVTQPDVTLKDRVAAEAPGVFAELVRRAKDLLNGVKVSEQGEHGQKVAARFAVSNDPVLAFVNQRCVLGADQCCEKGDVTTAFEIFREQHGISERFDVNMFFKTLYDRFTGVQQKFRQKRRVLVGIGLTEEEE